jgi:hypothetical protein
MKIRAKKDLYNKGRCFTKGKEYELRFPVSTPASLIDVCVVNDQNEPHIIGSWWREFELVNPPFSMN